MIFINFPYACPYTHSLDPIATSPKLNFTHLILNTRPSV